MMSRYAGFFAALLAGAALVGCSGEPPEGDVKTAQAASLAAQQSAMKMPDDAPPMARQQAQAATAQQEAMARHMQGDAQARARAMMNAQK
jgi:hypothetical protein